ncbi:unnamed protein product, partial [Symbiodinium sp. CCMP2456]
MASRVGIPSPSLFILAVKADPAEAAKLREEQLLGELADCHALLADRETCLQEIMTTLEGRAASSEKRAAFFEAKQSGAHIPVYRVFAKAAFPNREGEADWHMDQ